MRAAMADRSVSLINAPRNVAVEAMGGRQSDIIQRFRTKKLSLLALWASARSMEATAPLVSGALAPMPEWSQSPRFVAGL